MDNLILRNPVFARTNTEQTTEAIVIPAAQVSRVCKVTGPDGERAEVVTDIGTERVCRDTDPDNYAAVLEWAGLAQHRTRRTRKPAPKGA